MNSKTQALAAYACRDSVRGRVFDEPASPTRTEFSRDRDRIIHAIAFRRLMHKTQVFIAHTGDHYRTRLTHSMEVAQLARALACSLGANVELTEALALAHDLGHPPFGHAGEDTLKTLMRRYGGFDHNAQSLRIVTRLEQRYAAFDGLNLTWECLEGLVKHNGPLLKTARDSGARLPFAVRDWPDWRKLELHLQPGLEAQLAALADDIAYNNHDLDDGLRTGLLQWTQLADLPVIGAAIHDVRQRWPELDGRRLRHEVIRRVISQMLMHVVAETRQRLASAKIHCAHDIAIQKHAVVAFSDDMRKHLDVIKQFLHARLYRHHSVISSMSKARRLLKDLFALYLEEPQLLPPHWQQDWQGLTKTAQARVVCDYIAGMTDRFASQDYQRHFELARTLNQAMPIMADRQ